MTANKKLNLKENERIVYPPHGPVTVVGVEIQTIFGEEREYLVVRSEENDLVLKAPTDKLEEIGVRLPMPKSVAKEVLTILSEESTAQSAQWSRRFKAHNEKLHSGDPIQIAELIRNLEVADAKKPVSAGEKRLLKAARHSLEGELAITWTVVREEAGAKIDRALAINPEMVRNLNERAKAEKEKKSARVQASDAPAEMEEPTEEPSEEPTEEPSEEPTEEPSEEPTEVESAEIDEG